MPCWWQISGHVTDEEGKKRIALVGKWNSYLDMQKCDVEGTPLPGAQLVRLWTVHNASCCKCPHAMPLLLGAWQSDSKCTVHKQKGTAEE